MDGNTANSDTLTMDQQLREPDAVGKVIATFLSARSEVYRDLAQLREQVIKFKTQGDIT